MMTDLVPDLKKSLVKEEALETLLPQGQDRARMKGGQEKVKKNGEEEAGGEAGTSVDVVGVRGEVGASGVVCGVFNLGMLIGI
jgi:hypothetical protein